MDHTLALLIKTFKLKLYLLLSTYPGWSHRGNPGILLARYIFHRFLGESKVFPGQQGYTPKDHFVSGSLVSRNIDPPNHSKQHNTFSHLDVVKMTC